MGSGASKSKQINKQQLDADIINNTEETAETPQEIEKYQEREELKSQNRLLTQQIQEANETITNLRENLASTRKQIILLTTPKPPLYPSSSSSPPKQDDIKEKYEKRIAKLKSKHRETKLELSLKICELESEIDLLRNENLDRVYQQLEEKPKAMNIEERKQNILDLSLKLSDLNDSGKKPLIKGDSERTLLDGDYNQYIISNFDHKKQLLEVLQKTLIP